MKNKFIIKTNIYIDEIRAIGIKDIQVDPTRFIADGSQMPPAPLQPDTVKGGEQQKKATENLVTTIQDKNLLDNPSAENILRSIS